VSLCDILLSLNAKIKEQEEGESPTLSRSDIPTFIFYRKRGGDILYKDFFKFFKDIMPLGGKI